MIFLHKTLCHKVDIFLLGMDFPQINYMEYNGKPYKYGYGAGKEDVLFDCVRHNNTFLM